MISLGKDPKSVKDLAIEIGADPAEILEHMLVLKGRSQVNMDKIVGNTPIYMNVMEG